MDFNPEYRLSRPLPENCDPLQLCHQELALFEKERAALAQLDLELQYLKASNEGDGLRSWALRYLVHWQIRRYHVMRQMDSLLAQKMKLLSVEESVEE